MSCNDRNCCNGIFGGGSELIWIIILIIIFLPMLGLGNYGCRD